MTVRKKPSILLVEDDLDSSEILAELLLDEGHAVKTAHSMRTALDADLESIDLVLSDLSLPDGSGLDLMRELRTRSTIKGIIVSGFSSEDARRASVRAGYAAHLVKPVDFDDLLKTIDRVYTSD